MTEAEYQHFVRQVFDGKVLLGVDRVLARKVYTSLSLARIQELTGEAPYVEKGFLMAAFVAEWLVLLASLILAGMVFSWWALLIAPVCLFTWFVYKGMSCRGGAGVVLISLLLIGSAAAHFLQLIPNEIAGMCLISFAAALWLTRFVYCASSFFLRAFVLRNHKAFMAFEEGLRIVEV